MFPLFLGALHLKIAPPVGPKVYITYIGLLGGLGLGISNKCRFTCNPNYLPSFGVYQLIKRAVTTNLQVIGMEVTGEVWGLGLWGLGLKGKQGICDFGSAWLVIGRWILVAVSR